MPKALGLAAPRTANPINAAATESNNRLFPEAISPLPRRAESKIPPIEAITPDIT